MRIYYSSKRREFIGSLNRDKTLSAATIIAIRLAALNRSPVSEETRNKISSNSARAKLFLLSRLDKALFVSPNGNKVSNVVLRTIRVVSEFIGCGEKTVRRALKSDGIVKKTWKVETIGKANSS